FSSESQPIEPTGFMLHRTPRVITPNEKRPEQETLRSLFESEETPLLRYAFSLVRRRAVAEEIVQEVFLQLHVKWDEVESPRAWLYRSVRNRVFNYMRDNRREMVDMSAPMVAGLSNDTDTPVGALSKLEAIQVLHETIDSLEASDRELVQLKFFDGLKYREISERTGLSVGNVGYRLHHILKELAGKLHPLGIDVNS
ncbi:MAG: RNA polymerase sigma factor, partial [Rubripirellula sp.]